MDYVVIKAVAEGNAAHFKHIENFKSKYKFKKGILLFDIFPENASYRMNDDFPDSLALLDVLHNLDGQFIVSDKLKSFLQENGLQHVEYLPINIVNHKGRIVTKVKYSIVNILMHIDCIDQKQTEFTWDTLDEEEMDDVSNLTIDESKIDQSILIFRMKHLTPFVVIRRNLLEQMRAAGFRGFKSFELADIDY
jgi:hypothetical protein